jgi:hypothetical protein
MYEKQNVMSALQYKENVIKLRASMANRVIAPFCMQP